MESSVEDTGSNRKSEQRRSCHFFKAQMTAMTAKIFSIYYAQNAQERSLERIASPGKTNYKACQYSDH